jgi:glutathione S-transferase
MALVKIKELGLEDSVEFKNTLENSNFRSNHLEKTGKTTVPCLYINGEPLFESQDIINWLEENKNNI